MIIKESYSRSLNGVRLYRTYSDKGVYIQKEGTNEIYEEAIDMEGSDNTYIETEVPIKIKPEEKKK